jgi:putative tricarboxylic transport membrane protein
MRFLLALIGLLAALPATTAHAFTPSHAIEIVVHGPPGSGTEVFARRIIAMLEAEHLLAQPVTVVGRLKGSGVEAMEYLVANRGNDHMLGLFTVSWVAAPLVDKDAKAQLTDLTPLARLDQDPSLVIVSASSPWKTMAEFIAAAAAAPGTIVHAAGPPTAAENLNGKLLQGATKTVWTYVQPPTPQARIADLLAGKVHVLLPPPQDIKAELAAGRVRAIGAMTERRLAALPDVPTVKEQGIDVPLLGNARGFVAPPGLAPDVAAYWEDLFERLTRTPTWKKYLADNQGDDAFLKGQALTPFFTQQTALMRDVLKVAGVAVAR